MKRFNSKAHMVALAGMTAIALTLGGCKSSSPMHTGSIGAQAGQSLAALEKSYQARPDDPRRALAYAGGLKQSGDRSKAKAVLERGLMVTPNDAGMLSVYGRLVLEDGDANKAAAYLEKAESAGAHGWQTYSAKGTAYDMLGRHSDAQAQYRRALQQVPGKTSITSNLGMSQALSGDVKAAEATLRKAAANRDATAKVRQNLALVLGVQGKFDEARKVVSVDLSPQQADENMTYIRSMLKQDDRWKAIAAQSKQKS